MHYLMRSYGRLPVKFSHGSGAWLWDTLNNKYLDALCGIAVTGLGHAHPEVNDAVTKQIKKLSHVSNLYEIPEQELIARRLCDMSGMSKV